MKQYFKTDIDSYFGGKGSSFRHIINQVPPHDVKVVGFTGNCALSRHIKPASLNYFFDRDPIVQVAWEKTIADFNKKNENWAKFYQYCFLELLEFWENNFHIFHNNTFTYLDPPYHPDTRTGTTTYNHELTHDQHIHLLKKAKELPGFVAISHYPCKLYNEALKDWHYIEYETMTRGGTMRLERLYMNYPAPTELHDYTYFGKDYREREKFKRRAKSLFRKVERLNPLERKKFFEDLKRRYPTALTSGAGPTS